MYHNSKLSKFAFRTKIGLKWSFFAQTRPFLGFCFITNIYIWYIVGSLISRSARLKYFQIYQIYVIFLIMLFVYFLCQGRSFMLTAFFFLQKLFLRGGMVVLIVHFWVYRTRKSNLCPVRFSNSMKWPLIRNNRYRLI